MYLSDGYKKMKKLLIILCFLSLLIVGCTNSQSEDLILVCEGKYLSSETFDKQSPEKNVFDIKKIIRIEKHYLDSKNHNYEWVLSVDGESFVYLNNENTYPNLKTKTILFVDPHQVSMTWTNEGGEGVKEKNISRHITINRYTGDWSDETHEKTVKNNGESYSYRSRIRGSCEKGSTKF